MLGFLKKLFSKRTEQINPEEAAELYRREKSDEIERVEEKAQQLMKESEELVQEIDQALEELKDYEDDKGIQAVEDVADNFYRTRKKMIDNLELPENIQEHESELEEFSEEFNDVSVKEGKVLKHIDKGEGELPEAIQRLTDHVEKIQDFLEGDYSAITAHEELQEMIEEMEEKKSRLESLEEKLGDEKVKQLEKELEEKEQEIEELEESQEWRVKNEKEKEIEELKEDRQEIENWMSRQVSKVDRSLKKILYEVENGNAEFEGNLEKLRQLENQEFSDLEEVEEELSEAERILEENEIVEESQEEKFSRASRELSGLEERKQEIQSIDNTIESLEQQLEEMDVQDERQNLMDEKEELEQEIRDEKQFRDETREEVKRLEEEVKELESGLLRAVDRLLEIDVELADRD